MISVADYNFWHGYDRLIKGMKNYYTSGNITKKVYYHIVGDGPSLHEYIKLVEKCKLNEYVMFEGKKYGSELDDIYDKCNLAIDALGRHRSKVYYNSSLKGKEYGAKGLPIVSGVKTDLDLLKDYKYYFRVPADDSDIIIEDIISFYNEVYENSCEEEIINNIRMYNKNMFDFSNAFKPVLLEISNEQKSYNKIEDKI